MSVKDVLRSMSLQTKLLICICAMNIVLVFLSLVLILDAVEMNRRAERIAAISRCSAPLFTAIEALAFERGRTNVVLADKNPVTAVNKAFVAERRVQVDQRLKSGLEQLERFDPATARVLEREYSDFLKLRSRVDQQAERRLEEREAGFANEWYARSTDLIFRIKDELELLERKELSVDLFAIYHRMQISCVEFRIFSGHSGSNFTAAISQGRPITRETLDMFIENRAKADYIWENIDKDITQWHSPALISKKEQVQHAYYEMYRSFQNELLQQSLNGTVPAESVRKLTTLSVPAFDSVFDLINAISVENQSFIADMRAKAASRLKTTLLGFLLLLVFITLTLRYFRVMLFAPLKRIVNALHGIVSNQPVMDLDADVKRQDEIGWLAQGVGLLRLSMEEERRLREMNEMLATHDSLTGVYNRKLLEQESERAMAQADRYNEPVSILLFDLDHFKKVNDNWGHLAGDEVLKRTAQVVRTLIRNSDQLFRVGGEEFLILMPQTNGEQATIAAEKIRQSLEETQHPTAGQVTASIGIAEKAPRECFTDLYKRADDALYRAKHYGRNQVVYSDTTIRRMAWKAEWESGNAAIDRQHQHLLAMAEEFFNLSLIIHSEPDKLLPLLRRLIADVEQHFAFEEKLLQEVGYPDIHSHMEIHAQLLAKAAALIERYAKCEVGESYIISFILDEVIWGHLLIEDKRFFSLYDKNNDC